MNGSSDEQELFRWWRVFFDASPDAFLLIDPARLVLQANPSARRLLGRESSEVLGHALDAILVRSPGLAVTYGPLVSEGRDTVVRLERRIADGAPSGGMASLSLAQEYRYILSHELRTPLQAILGWTQILRATPHEPPAIQSALAAIERNVNWQSQVIEDLVQMAELAGETGALNTRRTSAASIVERAVKWSAPVAASKGVRLTMKRDTPDDEILADPSLLARALERLVTNAIRFASIGSEVVIRVHRVGPGVRIAVTDDGGQDDPASSHLYGWFRRSSESVSDFVRLGAGLTNVQRVVEMHGGSVAAESEGVGRGATFHVTIPPASDS